MERLLPNDVLFSNLIQQPNGLTEEQIQQKINDTFNRLIDERVNAIVAKKIENMKSSSNDSFLPIGTVVLTYLNPFSTYFDKKENEKHEVDKKLYQYELEMRKKGFILLGHYNLDKATKTVLTQKEYPEFLKYIQAINFNISEIPLEGGYGFDLFARSGKGGFDINNFRTLAWLYVGRPVGKLNTDYLYE